MNNRHLQTNTNWLKDGIVNEEEKALVERAYHLFEQFIDETEPIKELLPLNRYEVVARKSPSKRKVYMSALLSLNHKPLNKKDSSLKMFVKNERMNDVTVKAPRAIQARSPRYNLEIQRYLMPVEEFVFKRGYKRRISAKGLNQYQKAQLLREAWDDFNDPIAILLDHSRFDSRQHRLWIKREHEFYKKFYPGDDYFAKLLDAQVINSGASRNGTHYTVDGTRASGDANTSLGNSCTNFAIISYWLSHIPDKRIIVDGDDSVVFIERADHKYIDLKSLESLGFGTTYAEAEYFQNIDFCQCNPINTTNGWLMVRSPQRVIERSTVCIEENYSRTDLFRRWLASIGRCEHSCNRGVPVLSSFCRMLATASEQEITLSEDVKFRVITEDLSDVITNNARVDFYLAFGISIQQQLELELYYNTLDLTTLDETIVSSPTSNTSMVQLCLDTTPLTTDPKRL